MIVRHPNSTAKVFNFRETAPAKSTKDMYARDPQLSVYGGLSVGVPGEIMGYAEAHKMFGKLPWNRLFEESIEMTRDGFLVPPELADRIRRYADFIKADPEWDFLLGHGKLLKEHEMVHRKNFSNTLKEIAEKGPVAFYNGSISKRLVSYIREKGGIMTQDDFLNYNVSIEEPIVGWYHGREILTCGAPCSGPALIQALNILEGFPLGKHDRMTPKEVHLLVEAMKCTSFLILLT
jgi:gamma-glutamyltranspeptidase / glutathione hydrolase / leukotriene-C4 hydrolase